MLESGGADFAVYGAWDALAGFALELQGVFAALCSGRTAKNCLAREAKTLTMALAIAEPGRRWRRHMKSAAATSKLPAPRTKIVFISSAASLEWKQLNDAAELKDAIVQISEEFRGGPVFLAQLRKLYKKVETSAERSGCRRSGVDEDG